ncbi:MAG: SAP domain-containing protein [Kofleriaceae bacterium]
MRYTFTGELPIIVGELSYGVNADIEPTPDPEPPIGSTVVLNPGDTLITDVELTHHALIDPDAAGRYDKMRKPELVAELTERGLDTAGNVPELRERLQAHDAEHAGEAHASAPQEISGGSGSSAAGEILGAEAGAQPLAVGDVIQLSRELLGDTDMLGEIIELPDDAPGHADDDPAALVRWADGTESYPSLVLIERATDDPDAGGSGDPSNTDKEGGQ